MTDTTLPTTDRDPLPLTWQRVAAASGILFAILFLLTIIIGGATTPDRSDPVQDWTGFAEDNESKLRIASLVFAFAIYEFLWFLGYLRSVFGDAEGNTRGFQRTAYVVLAGGIVGIAGIGLGVFLNSAAAGYPENPEIVRGLTQAGGAGFGLAAPGFAAMLLTIGLLNGALRALPSWLGILAIITGVSFLLQLFTLLSEEYDNFFGIFFPIAFLGLFIFAIGSSVHFLQRLSTGSSPRTSA